MSTDPDSMPETIRIGRRRYVTVEAAEAWLADMIAKSRAVRAMRDSAPRHRSDRRNRARRSGPDRARQSLAEQDAPTTPRRMQPSDIPLEQSGGAAPYSRHRAEARSDSQASVEAGPRRKDSGGLANKDRPRFRISDINRLVCRRATTTAAAAVAPDTIAERGDYEWCSGDFAECLGRKTMFACGIRNREVLSVKTAAVIAGYTPFRTAQNAPRGQSAVPGASAIDR